jgi:hypothetical protein
MTRLLNQIQASTGGDFLRAVAAHTLQQLMALEVDSLIGAGRHECSDEYSATIWMKSVENRLAPGDSVIMPGSGSPREPGAGLWHRQFR